MILLNKGLRGYTHPRNKNNRMKSEENKNKVINEESLEKSMRKCIKGVSYKASVAFFYLNSTETVPLLYDQLKNNTYKQRKPKRFIVYYPKRRNIISISFRDRVYQRSLNDNVVYPAMTKGFIYDNAACQKGKGTDFARDRLKKMLRDYYLKYGVEGYVLKTDVRKYYDNIPHDYAKSLFRAKLDDWSYEQVCKVIDDQYSGEVGFSPGSQMIQILGISGLNHIDHFFKEKMRIKRYIRYQDDSVFISDSKTFLKEVANKQENLLNEIGLSLNKKKTKIVRITEGFEFLGFNYRLTKSGKVLMTIIPQKVKNDKHHLKNMVRKSKRGDLPREKVYESFNSTMAHYKKGNNAKLIMAMHKYYKELWKE